MDAGGRYVGGGEEAKRWLEIAESLLGARDLVGSKRFAERAMEADPLLDGVDQVLAVVQVLLAGKRLVNNQVDWYAVLQLPPPSGSSSGDDAAEVKRQYRRLALLLHPDRNKCPCADVAFSLVLDAFAILSDPTKKSLFDAEIHIAATAEATPKPSPSPPSDAAEPFWTTCPNCFHVHLYDREYLNLSLRCPTCRRSFSASEIPSPPPVVPGTDMYYCSWGFFPLGFPGGPRFSTSGGIAPDVDSEWKPFYPMFPNWSNNTDQPGVSVHPPEHRECHNGGRKDNVGKPQSVPTSRRKKPVARKKVGGCLKKRPLGGGNNGRDTEWIAVPTDGSVSDLESGMKPINLEEKANDAEEEFVRGININEEYKSFDHGLEEDPVSLNFHLDVDATDDILGNLHNLPF
ncbi:hypothetical protein Cni_G02127 [Canna indica]|uniref:J domain-containing protein n=1 Tax=Canna indica TaxID=4628 RepID=A0AAQ3Q1W1_9LILI|nr:hypothetical protein Cni_G02127 [Canna indica]